MNSDKKNIDNRMIPFNRPAMVGSETESMIEAVRSGKISGNGEFTKKVQALLESRFGIHRALLTTSCTDALEMAAMLLDIAPGDEVVVPSFSFVSTANAFVLRGATPVFVDVRADTLNLDEELLADAVTQKTKEIVPIHYAGVGCEMDRICDLARQKNIAVVEDAAQGVDATYGDKYLGAIGDLGTYSFHETKNLHCGEGGALCINNPALASRAEILWEKGTDRSRFFRGEVDKYTWVDIGSSFLPSDLLAAFLYAQFEHLDEITRRRSDRYEAYQAAFADLEAQGKVRLPHPPKTGRHNAHIFFMILPTEKRRDDFIAFLRTQKIHAVFHYLPLHLSPMGRRFGGESARCPVTIDLSARLVRLPLYHDMTENEQERVIDKVRLFFNREGM